MPQLPEPAYRQTLRDVAQELAGVFDTFANLHGHLSLRLDGVPLTAPVEGFARAPVPGHEGMSWSLLPPVGMPAGSYSHMIVCGQQGVHFPRTTLPHALRICVLAGTLLWSQYTAGPEPRHLGPGEYVEVQPGEEYGYTILTDYTGYLTFSPAL